MNDNPSMASYPVSYTNDPHVIAQNDHMISVNSTIEVDILGQCNSEYLGGFEYSGTGGQLDYVRGAFNSAAASPSSPFMPRPTTVRSPGWSPALTPARR